MFKQGKLWAFLIGLILATLVVGSLAYSFRPYRPRVAILYIATGRYIVFWDKFYESAEKNLLPEYDKHYFIWTDHTDKKFPENVTVFPAKYTRVPDVLLKRWHMFLEQENILKNYDYMYFFNANTEIVAPIHAEIFPTPEQGITVTIHPRYWGNKSAYTYERNPKSTAYIPKGKGKYYVAGGFNGGRSADFLRMSHICAENTDIDEKNGIMAIWHDESHLNRYILDKKPLILLPNYLYAPLGNYKGYALLEGTAKIKLLNKDSKKYGGRDYLRGLTDHHLGEKPKNGIPMFHPMWKKDYLVPDGDKYYRFGMKKDRARIERKDNQITVFWDDYAPEVFVLQSDGFYHLQ